MRQSLMTFLTIALCILALQAVSQEKNLDRDQKLEIWKKLSAPGENHNVLGRMIGKWKTTTKVWPSGPGSTVSENSGSSTFRWILGKRHVQQESNTTVLGMKVEAVGFFGYDNFKRKYTHTWMESTSTARYISEGAIDRDGNMITLHGKMDEFLTGEHDKVVRYELEFKSPTEFEFRIFDLGLGKDSLVVQTTYSKVETPEPANDSNK